ncbi:hypothetical protein Kfla_0758 [Kribbella flavida DSM 17836]|uniref:PPE family domain-containing protein n=1 Tax=Kribbella flavida (strain DSM 17836 / JCM 10339 / NBRC 14399) TaxID=479435 RepID=D2PYN1_KRIFD|nr:hypothetical protein [Kribbella flavida]ADB29877.1 hypothetical protein Kfla_0758 [Kribbella flavida DSM 17836]
MAPRQYPYDAAATAAVLIVDLQTAMNDIDATAQAERALESPLRTSAEMWQKSRDAIDGVIASFPTVAGNVLSIWRSRVESETFRTATAATTQSLVDSHSSIGGEANARNSGSGIPQTLVLLADLLRDVAGRSTAVKTALDAAVEQFNQHWDSMPTMMTAKAASEQADARRADEVKFVNQWRETVVGVGKNLNIVATTYQVSGPQLVAAAQGLKWAGPAGESSPSTSMPRSTGGPAMSSSGPTDLAGGPAGGPSAVDGGGPAEAAGGPTEAAGGPTGGAGDPAAAEGGPAGGAGGPGSAGGAPTGPGGTGLAGTGTLPKPPTSLPPGSLPPGSLPGSLPGGFPPGGLPVGGIPLPPVGTGTGSSAAKGIGAGDQLKVPGATGLSGGGLAGRGLSGGGLGGGGLSGGGLSGGGLSGGGLKGSDLTGGRPGGDPSVGDRPIPRASEPLTAPQQQATGRAPAAPTGIGTGAPAAPVTAGGAPPMMPPGAAAAAPGGGRGGKAATGAVRPLARGRNRQAGETPGIPAGLRGRSSEQAFTAPTRRRPERDPQAETLQLLDEELWQVEEPEAAAPKRARRLVT